MEGVHTNYWRVVLITDIKNSKNILSYWEYLIKKYDRKDVCIDDCPKTFRKYQTLRKWYDDIQGLMDSLESYESAMTDQLLSQGKLNTRLIDENNYLRSVLTTTNKINLFHTTRKTKTENATEQIHNN